MADTRTAPGPRGLPVLGNTRAFARDPLAFYCAMAREYGDVVKLGLAGKTCFLLNHPDHVAHVLQTHIGRYRKSNSYREIALLLGDGLVTSEGEVWKRHRHIANPAFHRSSLHELIGKMFEGADATADSLRPHVGDTVDLEAVCTRTTLRIAGQALFGTRVGDLAEDVERSLHVALDYVNGRAEALFPLPHRLPTPTQRRFIKARDTLDAVVYEVIARRRAEPDAGGDLLSMLMNARMDDDAQFSDKDLRDEALTLLMAAHETTAVTLTWTLTMLSRHPQIRAQAEAEVDAAWEADEPRKAVLGTDLVPRVVQEVLRLYPPAWSLTRVALEDDVIGGFEIPKGTVVIVSPYLAHRDPRYWDNPEGFDPARFTPEASEGRPRFVYLPFSAGQRMCLGDRFAMMEMKIVLARLIREFRLDLVSGVQPVILPSLLLRPRDPVPMTVHAR